MVSTPRGGVAEVKRAFDKIAAGLNDAMEFQRLIEKHADVITLELLLDLAKAFGLRLSVKLIDQ